MAEDFHTAPSVAWMQHTYRLVNPRYEVTGYVIDHAIEPDGDHHFNLADVDHGSIAANASIEDYLVCEIIPEIPIEDPPLHARITVRGIVRQDIGHGWPELHPVLGWDYAAQ